MTPAGFPHSDTPGSTLGCQLPRAYRRLLRPSSALDAKASTMCPSQLVTHTTNPTHHPATSNTKKTPPTPPPTGRHKRSPHSQQTQPPTMNQTWQCTQHTTKMLASTIQISNNNPTPEPPAPPRDATELEPGSWNRSPRHPRPQLTPGGPAPDSSEPQQCAPTPRSTRQGPRPDRHGSSRYRPETGTGNVDDSTSEHHHAPTTLKPPAQYAGSTAASRGVCSLERR